ncbi:MAG: hypothetical protein Tsb009_02130 [Planctomycetaceae bacterium]
MQDANSHEDTYGLVKRFHFIRDFLAEQKPKSVLDVGCGTGNNLTVPLSREFPETQFVGTDADVTSIEYAQRKNGSDNLSFRLTDLLEDNEKFDVVIASEVIEHVEDPKDFLRFLNSKLAPGGRIVLTLPNGYGPFELGSFCQTVLHLTGMLTVLRKIKHVLVGQRKPANTSEADGGEPASAGHDTLAISPHLNFFSYKKIKKLIRSSALKIERYKPRTFLCGFGFDQTIRSKMIHWNARIADKLPARMNSGWMFILQNGGRETEYTYRRNWYARFRRYLNEKQWGLA